MAGTAWNWINSVRQHAAAATFVFPSVWLLFNESMHGWGWLMIKQRECIHLVKQSLDKPSFSYPITQYEMWHATSVVSSLYCTHFYCRRLSNFVLILTNEKVHHQHNQHRFNKRNRFAFLRTMETCFNCFETQSSDAENIQISKCTISPPPHQGGNKI